MVQVCFGKFDIPFSPMKKSNYETCLHTHKSKPVLKKSRIVQKSNFVYIELSENDLYWV